MYFCPKCNNSFDVSKSSGIETDARTPISDIHEALKKVKTDSDLSNYSATFTKAELHKDKHYIKLTDNMKKKLDILFNIPSIGGIEFKCNNCNFRKKIKDTIKLYQINIGASYSVFRSMDDNKLLSLNPIYPRTKDYTCKNINCVSHKDIKMKVAVFFREKDSYMTNYICGVCYSAWKVQ